ncbi:efflux RND transporter periplasmic adaptor subunit [Rahnella victoriana]|uniref:Efflux RND transporter periplasmic adaptor subunit n=1 Tax=Rahnella victoriana TaxID=1510570 RepID=A0ABS0DNI9_9GAMM|nr:efflux RND transporter periplasmic adaptor subunit [Rahnella victoriana]MBF7955454.1 efflux RND transporter periplasmic adaptor subunit [Rahnella victoriana]
MTSAKTCGLLAASVLIALAAGFTAGRHSQPDASSASATPAERKVLYWYDPMTPDQRFDKPGKSPFMDMDLMPRYADEVADDGGVTVSARQQQNLGMRSEKVQMRMISAPLNVYGTVSADERSLRTVAARANGLVEKLYVAASQQQVKKGQKLATLWIPDWTAAQQEYLAVRQLGDRSLTAAARQRLALQFMPEDVLRRVDKTGQPQTRTDVLAPEDGYLSQLSVREGAQVSATQPLFELTSLKQVWMVMDYPPSAASQIHTGSKVTASTDSQPGEVFHGTVSELLPDVDAVSRTLKARVVMDNPQQKLRPGMYLNLSPDISTQKPVLAIPQEALIQTGSRNTVLLNDGNGHFTPQAVITGATRDGWTQVLSGLEEGQSVVTSGQFLIDSEASLRSALPATEAQQPDAHQHGGDL